MISDNKAGSHTGPFIPVVCAIIERDSRFLAAQRSNSKTNGGLWEFPGGKVHENETLWDGLVREIQEELGVKIEYIDQLSSVNYTYPWIAIELIPFRVKLVNTTEPIAHEHQELRWVTLEESENLTWAPADRIILQEYKK